MSKTYLYVDVVPAVLYHVDVSRVDGLFVVLDPSRPISSGAKQLRGSNQKPAGVRQWGRHQVCGYHEVKPFAFKQPHEYSGLSGTCGSRESGWVGSRPRAEPITKEPSWQSSTEHLFFQVYLSVKTGDPEVPLSSISEVPLLVAEWGDCAHSVSVMVPQ